MDEKHYAYLPGVLMHEFPHTLGLPDTHNADYVDNPDDHVGDLMHYRPGGWDYVPEDELKDEFKDGDSELLGTYTRVELAPIVDVVKRS